MSTMMPLDPTWWRRDPSGEFHSQQNGAARLVKFRTGRKVIGWILYVHGDYRGQWATLPEAKHGALEITP